MEDIFKDIRPIVENNIQKAIAANTLNAKVMPGDHVVTSAERQKYVFTYDIGKKRLKSKINRYFANLAVNKKTKEIGKNIKIVGLENALKVKDTSFIITSNHYSPFDSLVVRHLTNTLGKKNKLSIVINESNLFMGGTLGKIVKSIDVLPYANDLEYLGKVFNPILPSLVKKNRVILIYPEQEMWLDYPFVRPLMPGAYHYATKLNIPILPIFVTWEKDNTDNIYTIHVGEALYPDQTLSLFDNKKIMSEQDITFKKSINS
ncbi:MAG: 1-acyl-sn-glycerol-3-phosphate acyltransferase [Bacilli bacterium]|nr:1-acyl-sn-glycerol-3-phosphate acyltransferase [Bacilli bacterium]